MDGTRRDGGRWTAPLRSLALAGALLWVAACERRAVKEPPPQSGKTVERLLETSAARWAHVVAGEWAATYDDLAPGTRGDLSLAQYLEGKQNHRYEDPSAPELVGFDAANADVAFVRVEATWTPAVEGIWCPLEAPGLDDPRCEMIETWEWSDGAWGMRWPPQRPSDFFGLHPELLRRADAR